MTMHKVGFQTTPGLFPKHSLNVSYVGPLVVFAYVERGTKFKRVKGIPGSYD